MSNKNLLLGTTVPTDQRRRSGDKPIIGNGRYQLWTAWEIEKTAVGAAEEVLRRAGQAQEVERRKQVGVKDAAFHHRVEGFLLTLLGLAVVAVVVGLCR